MESAFIAAQRAAVSEAAASLAQMSVRQARGDTALSRLVRERQDLIAEWEARERLLTGALSLPPERRNQAAEREQRQRLAAIDARLGEIDAALARDFPDYAALANPEPLTIAAVQALLAPGEALVLFLDAPPAGPLPEQGFAWAITRTDARWVRIGAGPQLLATYALALRCGLDRAAWSDERARQCAALLRTPAPPPGAPLPFDLARAHELYALLFGGIEDLVRDKHLLIVPPAALAGLPIHVLVTARPAPAADGERYAGAAWLARRNAVTVLPAAASLSALRRLARASAASAPFIGFGNPLLTGPEGRDRSAWERQACRAAPPSRQMASRGAARSIPRFFRGGLANVEEVRSLDPLPETADELCAVARSTGAGEAAVHLGQAATEAAVKTLSGNGELARARIVHFATHGLLAGETEMLAAARAEPALVLTPPAQASEEDDGLLAASEIAQLKLDADWVVLSACNTAAGDSDKPGAEALSGLARAFFYAGARALLVSHWAVNSQATVDLVTGTFEALRAAPAIGRAEALRRSMLVLVGRGGDHAHPATWAPFVVVGEGAR